MRCPTLAELPPPPPGKTGWPWTEESEQLPDEMPALGEAAGADDRPATTDDMPSSIVHRPSSRPWPKISIVTPSYNQGQFIEETIRSVLLQGYPDLEYMVIDGGSDDGSVEIIKKYEPWLAYWVSEPDRGQSHAINKGWERATGEIMAWLNSDDLYRIGAFQHAAIGIQQRENVAFLYSDCSYVDEQSEEIHRAKGHVTDFEQMLLGNVIDQQTVFIRARALRSSGLLREELNYVMDYELWLRLLQYHDAAYVPGYTACFRRYKGTKTFSDQFKWREEVIDLLEDESFDLPEQHRRLALGRAHFMVSLSYLASDNDRKTKHHYRQAVKYGLFRSRASIDLAARRTLAWLTGAPRNGYPFQTIQELQQALEAFAAWPPRFWSAVYALQETRRAENSMRCQQWDGVRQHVVRALRLNPALLLESYFWPLAVAGLLGPRSLGAAVSMKRALRSLRNMLLGGRR